MQKIISTPHSNLEIRTFGKKEVSNLDFSSPKSTEILQTFLSDFYGVPRENIIGMQQVHGIQIHKAEESIPPLVGDGLWTERKDLILVVKTADCMPLFFWSNTHPLIGVLHSGWKGTRDGITQEMIQILHSKFPKIGLQFYLGPCIRGTEYEVKEDVSIFFESYKKSTTKIQNQIYLGLEHVVKEVLEKREIPMEDCEISSLSHPDYFSHRGKDTGRNLNVIRFLD